MSRLRGYSSPFNLGHKYLKGFWKGTIYATEKIDGSQFGFGLVEGELVCRSRRQQINLDDPGMFQLGVATARDLADQGLLQEGWTYRGEYLCLSGETRIKKASGGQHEKYMTLATLYELQNAPPSHGYKSKGLRKRKPRATRRQTRWEKDGFPSLYSLDIQRDLIVQNPIQRIVATGIKDVYRVETRKGLTIKSTAEHRFWTPTGWRTLSEIRTGDCVGVLDDRYYKNLKINYGQKYKEVNSLWAEIKKDATCEGCGIGACLEIHHVDGNRHNNKRENLKVFCVDCHKALPKTAERKPEEYEFDAVVSIEHVGREECYDVEMSGNENLASFVAECFLVHNSKPKHNTMAYDRVPRGNIILFDIDRGDQDYVTPSGVVDIAANVDLESVPLLETYFTKPKLEDMTALLKTESVLGGGNIEGVVLKNYDLFGQDKKVLMAKVVSEVFKEKHSKSWKVRNPGQGDFVRTLTAGFATEARWMKAVQHLREAGELEGIPQDIPAVMREIVRDVEEDLEAEVRDALYAHFWPKIRRGLTKGAAEWYKRLLAEEGMSEKV